MLPDEGPSRRPGKKVVMEDVSPRPAAARAGCTGGFMADALRAWLGPVVHAQDDP
jgi:hypothetical protein